MNGNLNRNINGDDLDNAIEHVGNTLALATLLEDVLRESLAEEGLGLHRLNQLISLSLAIQDNAEKTEKLLRKADV